MKKLKNNKGITGVDITASIVIIIISIGLISTMYSKYSENTKQVKRNTEAINLATDFVEYIEKVDYDKIDEKFEIIDEDTKEKADNIVAKAEDDIVSKFGIEVKQTVEKIPSGYTVTIKKIEEVKGVSAKFNIEVKYNVSSQEKKVSINKVKNTSVKQVNSPDISDEKLQDLQISVEDTTAKYNRYLLKYSNKKQGYIKAKQTDKDWYTLSGKRYAIVAYAEEKAFSVDGVIDLEDCKSIYVWVPRFGKYNGTDNYGFCYKMTNNPIKFGESGKIKKDIEEYNINGYYVDTEVELDVGQNFINTTGEWVEVNYKLNPIDDSENEIEDSENILNILKTKNFIWE